MRRVQIAVIGSGVIGKRHISAIAESPHAELTAIIDPDVRAQELAADAGVPWFSTAELFFADSATHDQRLTDTPLGVIVATPTEHHLTPSLAALNAGAHVLVEKPIMPTLEEAAQIIECSARTGRHVLVGHHRRYYDQVHKARELIQRGELGQLVAVTGQWTVRKDDPYYDPDWRKEWKAGPILTNLIHEIDTLRYVCGDVASVSAETSNAIQSFEKEDVAALVMRFVSGALGTFIISDQASSPWSWEFATGENAAFPASGQNALRFMGTRASLEFPNLVLWQHENPPGDWTQVMHAETISMPLEDAYINQINHFAAVIQGEIAPRISAQDATDTLRATLCVYEAARTGERVTLA